MLFKLFIFKVSLVKIEPLQSNIFRSVDVIFNSYIFIPLKSKTSIPVLDPNSKLPPKEVLLFILI